MQAAHEALQEHLSASQNGHADFQQQLHQSQQQLRVSQKAHATSQEQLQAVQAAHEALQEQLAASQTVHADLEEQSQSSQNLHAEVEQQQAEVVNLQARQLDNTEAQEAMEEAERQAIVTLQQLSAAHQRAAHMEREITSLQQQLADSHMAKSEAVKAHTGMCFHNTDHLCPEAISPDTTTVVHLVLHCFGNICMTCSVYAKLSHQR